MQLGAFLFLYIQRIKKKYNEMQTNPEASENRERNKLLSYSLVNIWKVPINNLAIKVSPPTESVLLQCSIRGPKKEIIHLHFYHTK